MAIRKVSQATATLSTGNEIPLVGLGTWKSKPGVVGEAVKTALESGYRHIDCAAIYGNEPEVGASFKAVFDSGELSRADVFVTSKLWNSNHAPEKVRPACEKTLSDLKLEYLDLYLVHWPIVAGQTGDEVQPPLAETWKAMEELVDAGLVRAIGVSNFSIKKLSALLESCRIPPAVLQVEVHPYWRNDSLIGFCRSRGIHVTAYSPLGSPDSASMFARDKGLELLKLPVALEIAEKHGKNVGQVLIRWALQHGTSVVPKSTTPARIASNLEVFDWELSAADFRRLETLPEQERMVNGKPFLNPAGPYRTKQDLWDEPDDGVAVDPLPSASIPALAAPPKL